jgi:hypothetical protein
MYNSAFFFVHTLILTYIYSMCICIIRPSSDSTDRTDAQSCRCIIMYAFFMCGSSTQHIDNFDVKCKCKCKCVVDKMRKKKRTWLHTHLLWLRTIGRRRPSTRVRHQYVSDIAHAHNWEHARNQPPLRVYLIGNHSFAEELQRKTSSWNLIGFGVETHK